MLRATPTMPWSARSIMSWPCSTASWLLTMFYADTHQHWTVQHQPPSDTKLRFCLATAARLHSAALSVVRCLSRSSIVSKRLKIRPQLRWNANETVPKFSKGTISNDLVWYLSYISKFQQHAHSRSLSATTEIYQLTASKVRDSIDHQQFIRVAKRSSRRYPNRLHCFWQLR